MTHLVARNSEKADPRPGKTRITIIDYDEKHFQEKEAKSVEECFPFKDKPTVTWINVDGVRDTALIERIGKRFGVHPLVLEDIVHTRQRPKTEDFGSYLFIVLKMIYFEEKSHKTRAEQVSLILGKNFVISFQEKEGDVFNQVREKIRRNRGRIRGLKADYLAYSLVDAIIDGYFVVLELVGDRVELLEKELVGDPKGATLNAIYKLKRETILLRKSVWPLREVASGLERGESPLVQKSTRIYLRDLYDHTIQVIDTIETYRDLLSGMVDLYLSSISNRMNEVMKVLTVIATIFIPLTFIAGVYGMNFRYMPELGMPLGYPAVLLGMLVVGALMLLYFKKKNWL